jgi:hypothetical protein
VYLAEAQEYDPIVTRETMVNVGLGFILLIAFAVPILGCIGAVGVVLYAVDVAVKHFFPAVARPWDVEFYGFLCLVIFVVGARQAWRHLWANAFLSFTAALSIIVPWLFNLQLHHRFSGLALQFPITWFVVYLLPGYSRISLGQFVSCASIIAVSFALNAGLLGAGTLSTIVGATLSIAIIARVLVDARDGKYGEPWSFFSASRT